MDLRQSVHTGQHLAISPGLYQSLNILRLSALELRELIQQQLVENPTLELPEPSESALEQSGGDLAAAPGEDLWRDLAATGSGSAAERRDPLRTDPGAASAELAAAPISLTDHLAMQLNLTTMSGLPRRCALAVIASLDDDGYLRVEDEEIAAIIDATAADIKMAVLAVQKFDPPGIAARSLEECLAIQLRQLAAAEPAESIVHRCLPLLARGDLKKIAKTLPAPLPAVEAAVEIIRSLDPSPGSRFDASPPAAAIIPDIYINNVGGEISILANREIQPPLKISALYREMAAATGKGAKPVKGEATDAETSAYVREKIAQATELIRGIEQRRATLTRVARAIAAGQPEFFKLGPEHLRPLTLSDIASSLEVHQSTVSRAIMGKYMSTPYGIFEFRYFFSAGYAACEGKIAATAVRQRLRGIISREDRLHPLSDQKLADLLKNDDIPISRRTVAKYREEMGIAPSWDRKNP